MAVVLPGAQDQPERSLTSTDKADRKKNAAPRKAAVFSSAVASEPVAIEQLKAK
jgi:hypothetical protein